MSKSSSTHFFTTKSRAWVLTEGLEKGKNGLVITTQLKTSFSILSLTKFYQRRKEKLCSQETWGTLTGGSRCWRRSFPGWSPTSPWAWADADLCLESTQLEENMDHSHWPQKAMRFENHWNTSLIIIINLVHCGVVFHGISFSFHHASKRLSEYI